MSDGFLYTDGWHPTVNPSARMAVHHYRFLQLLETGEGVLNEIPRYRGGSTLRVMRFGNDGRFQVTDLAGTAAWMPWWIPAGERWASDIVADVYRKALGDSVPTTAEKAVYGRVVEAFEAGCGRGGDRTVGEVLHLVLDGLHRELDPSLPALNLVSVTRSSARFALADALAAVPGGLTAVLKRWAEAENKPLWGLGFAISSEGVPLTLRFRARSGVMEVEPLDCDGSKRHRGKRQPVGTDQLVEMLRTGRLVPGSRLTAIAEVVLAGQGTHVRHYGNTYGRLEGAARHLGVEEANLARITFWADDADSWHFADVNGADAARYPLHLLDVLACGPRARTIVPHLISESLCTGQPVHLEARESLDASLSA